MEANGIERAPRTAAELGLQASAAAQQLELPSIPVVPQGPQHEVPASLGVAEEEEQSQQQQKKPAARKAAVPTAATGTGAAAGCEAAATGAAAPQETATAAVAPVAGAAEGHGDADGARAGEGAVPADQKQASVDAKLKGNACFQRHQWQQVRASGWPAGQLHSCKLCCLHSFSSTRLTLAAAPLLPACLPFRLVL